MEEKQMKREAGSHRKKDKGRKITDKNQKAASYNRGACS
jgi:hypothetical protein